MSLNDEALAELHVEINSVGDENKSNNSSILNNTILDINPISKDDEKITESVESCVVDIKSHLNRLSDFSSVAKELTYNKGVSKSIAISVEEIIGGLFNTKITLPTFSSEVSKTNFNYTLNLTNKKISIEQDAVIDKFKRFIENPLEDLLKVAKRLDSDYIRVCSFNIERLLFRYKNTLNKIQGNKDIVVMHKGLPVNLSDVVLSDLNITQTNIKQDFAEEINLAASNLDNLFKNLVFKSFVLGSIDSKSVDQCLAYSTISEYSEKNISSKNILEIYQNGLLVENVNQLHNKVINTISQIEKIIEEGTYLRDDCDKIHKFILTKSSLIQQFTKDVKDLCQVIFGIEQMNINSESLLKFYQDF